jgi:hypothetical protein
MTLDVARDLIKGAGETLSLSVRPPPSEDAPETSADKPRAAPPPPSKRANGAHTPAPAPPASRVRPTANGSHESAVDGRGGTGATARPERDDSRGDEQHARGERQARSEPESSTPSGGFDTSFEPSAGFETSFATSFENAFDGKAFDGAAFDGKAFDGAFATLPPSAFGESTPFGEGTPFEPADGFASGDGAAVPAVPAGVQGEAEAAFEELRALCVASHGARRELVANVAMLVAEVRRLEDEVADLRAAAVDAPARMAG